MTKPTKLEVKRYDHSIEAYLIDSADNSQSFAEFRRELMQYPDDPSPQWLWIEFRDGDPVETYHNIKEVLLFLRTVALSMELELVVLDRHDHNAEDPKISYNSETGVTKV